MASTPSAVSSDSPSFQSCRDHSIPQWISLGGCSDLGEGLPLGLELQALSMMLMKQAVFLVSQYNHMETLRWPTKNWLMGMFMELNLLSSDLVDAHDELWHPRLPIWFIRIVHLYYINNFDQFSNDN